MKKSSEEIALSNSALVNVVSKPANDYSIVFRGVYVTPSIAKTWLATCNNANRPLSPHTAARYERVMKRGDWCLTHQGVAFDPEGNLVDGQHRLQAIVQSGEPTMMLVAIYTDALLASSAKLAVDTGAKRTNGDILVLTKTLPKCGANIAATITGMCAIEGMTAPEVAEMATIYNNGKEAIEWSVATFPKKAWPAPIRAALAYAYPINPTVMREFGRQVVERVGYSEGSAAHYLACNLESLARRCSSVTQAMRVETSRMILRLAQIHVTNEPMPKRLIPGDVGYDYFYSRRQKQGMHLSALRQ